MTLTTYTVKDARFSRQIHAEILINVMNIAMSIKQIIKKKPMFVILQFIWKFIHQGKFSHPNRHR
jgi:hypothetical protein